MINSHDAGRLLQSAASFDGYGECYNPTEGGNRTDYGVNAYNRPQASHSKLLYQAIDLSVPSLTAETQMAFWFEPTARYLTQCPKRKPVNTTVLSKYTIRHVTSIQPDGIIEVWTKLKSPESRKTAVLEMLTGYLHKSFSKFWKFDKTTHTRTTLSDGPGEQPYPVIMSTPDGVRAMGIYCDGSPEQSGGYGRWRFTAEETVKWNVVWRTSNFGPGEFTAHCYVPVGTLEEVTSLIDSL